MTPPRPLIELHHVARLAVVWASEHVGVAAYARQGDRPWAALLGAHEGDGASAQRIARAWWRSGVPLAGGARALPDTLVVSVALPRDAGPPGRGPTRWRVAATIRRP